MNATTTAVCLAGTALASAAYALRVAFEHDDLIDSDHADSGWARRTGGACPERIGVTELVVPAPAQFFRGSSGARLVAAV